MLVLQRRGKKAYVKFANDLMVRHVGPTWSFIFQRMGEHIQVPQAILTGKRLPTDAERALIPDHLLPESCRAKSTSSLAVQDEPVVIAPEKMKQCNSCRKTATNYTEKCAACELFICMADECCNVADSRIFDGGSSSAGGSYVCNICDKEQQAKLKRLRDTPTAKTVQQTYKPPIMKKKAPNLDQVASNDSNEDAHSDDTLPDPDFQSRIWLEKVRDELVLLNKFYLLFMW